MNAVKFEARPVESIQEAIERNAELQAGKMIASTPNMTQCLIEQALELLLQMQDGPKKTALANTTASALMMQIENAIHPLVIAETGS